MVREAHAILPPGPAPIAPGARRAHVIERLGSHLYYAFYRPGRPVPRPPSGGGGGVAEPEFVDLLSAANLGRGGWQSGWRVLQNGPTVLRVERGGLRARGNPDDVRPVAGTPGSAISVRRPNEHRKASPGFYFALSDHEPEEGPSAVEVRVYFHVNGRGAIALIRAVTGTFNRLRIPYSLKVLDHPAEYTRCDPAVLYLDHGDFERVRAGLHDVVADCRSWLRPTVPPLTKTLAPGVAVAEHRTADGGSFGSSRCRLLAEAIVGAHEDGARAIRERLDVVARHFADAGLDLDRPYLADPAHDDYAF